MTDKQEFYTIDAENHPESGYAIIKTPEGKFSWEFYQDPGEGVDPANRFFSTRGDALRDAADHWFDTSGGYPSDVDDEMIAAADVADREGEKGK